MTREVLKTIDVELMPTWEHIDERGQRLSWPRIASSSTRRIVVEIVLRDGRYGFEAQNGKETIANYYQAADGWWRPRDNAIDFCEHAAHDAVSGRIGRIKCWAERSKS